MFESIFAIGGVPAAGLIFGNSGITVPAAGVLRGAGGDDRGTTGGGGDEGAAPPMSVFVSIAGGGAEPVCGVGGIGVPEAGVRRRGTIGDGDAAMPMSVLPAMPFFAPGSAGGELGCVVARIFSTSAITSDVRMSVVWSESSEGPSPFFGGPPF